MKSVGYSYSAQRLKYANISGPVMGRGRVICPYLRSTGPIQLVLARHKLHNQETAGKRKEDVTETNKVQS